MLNIHTFDRSLADESAASGHFNRISRKGYAHLVLHVGLRPTSYIQLGAAFMIERGVL